MADTRPPGDDLDNFHGHEHRECGEHHTCGYRAWCFDCTEWCSPDAPCKGCELPALRGDYTAALGIIARLTTGWGANRRDLGPVWFRNPIIVDEGESCEESMSDAEWRVYCGAAQQATQDTKNRRADV